jgi:hypothetical protein
LNKALQKKKKCRVKYDESKLVGTKGNHPLRLSIINLAIAQSTVKEKSEKQVENLKVK